MRNKNIYGAMITALLIIAFCFAVLSFSSCDSVVALGNKIMMEGPEVTIGLATPKPRQPIKDKFYLAGTVTDKTGIAEVVVRVTYDTDNEQGKVFPARWKWTPATGWVMSVNSGPWVAVEEVQGISAEDENGSVTTIDVNADWLGSNTSARFTVPISLIQCLNPLGGDAIRPEGGQYQIIVSAKNISGTSDSRSFQSRTVVVYANEPGVSIVSPALLSKTNSELIRLSGLSTEADRHNPVDIRSLLNREVDLKWTVQEENDIWSLDIRFYALERSSPFNPSLPFGAYSPLPAIVDGPLDDSYVYRLNINGDEPVLIAPPLSMALNPNGAAEVPDLTTAVPERKVYLETSGNNRIYHYVYATPAPCTCGLTHSEAGVSGATYLYTEEIPSANVISALSKPTAVMVVMRCVNFGDLKNDPYEDPSDPPNMIETRIAGCFIYWPEADKPWIDNPNLLWGPYRGGPPELQELYTVFPRSTIFPRAYDDDGVYEVEYKIYKIDENDPHITSKYTLITTADPYNYYCHEDANGNGISCGGCETGVHLDTKANGTKTYTWNFMVPKFQGEYKIEAIVRDTNIPSSTETAEGYFKIMDLSKPKLSPPDIPEAAMPLYRFIDTHASLNVAEWTLKIEGKVSAFTEIDHVAMAWINPKSINYAAMSQLSFFRDANYGAPDFNTVTGKGSPVEGGWLVMPAKTVDDEKSPPGLDYRYDSTFTLSASSPYVATNVQNGTNPNKVWRMKLSDWVPNAEGQKVYTYSKTLNLKSDLYIDPGVDPYNYLKSQVFVLKAADNSVDVKNDIITWAPQGDTEAPEITITSVQIQRSGKASPPNMGEEDYLEPGVYAKPIAQFYSNDKIIVKGTWKEESLEYLNLDAVLKNQLKIFVNDKELTGNLNTTKVITNLNGTSGTWEATGIVIRVTENEDGSFTAPATHALVGNSIKDTLVVNAVVTDVGGNKSEFGGSWLIISDTLGFLRVGSTTPDGTFSQNSTPDPTLGPGEIDVFLEFNKPVKLKRLAEATTKSQIDAINTDDIALTLNVSGTDSAPSWRAYYYKDHPDHYEADHVTPRASTRHHFRYKILGDYNHTTGTAYLDVSSLFNPTASPLESDNYTYTWVAVGSDENIRMVNNGTNYSGGMNVDELPSAAKPAEALYTLVAGKHITIDTVAPVLQGTKVAGSASRPYILGSIAYLTMTFSEAINADTSPGTPKTSGSVLLESDFPNVNKSGHWDWLNPEFPRLVLNIKNNNAPSYTQVETTEAYINNNVITFVYPIKDGEYTPTITDAFGGSLTITGFKGKITDQAGNEYNPPNYSGGQTSDTSRPINSLFEVPKDNASLPLIIKAIKPEAPTVYIYKGDGAGVVGDPIAYSGFYSPNPASPPTGYSGNPTTTNDKPVSYLAWNRSYASDFVAPPIPGPSQSYTSFPIYNAWTPPIEDFKAWFKYDLVDMGSLYYKELFTKIVPSGAKGIDYERIEWSVDYGNDWGVYFNKASVSGGKYDEFDPAYPPIPRAAQGQGIITARQVDSAGNVSDWSKPIIFMWDKGDLLTRISSPLANATYTNRGSGPTVDAKQIPITFTFRKPVQLTAIPELILNVYRRSEGSPWPYDSGDPFNTPYNYYPSYSTTKLDGSSFSPAAPTGGYVKITQEKWYDAQAVGGKNLGASIVAAPTTPTDSISSFTFLYTVGPYDTTFSSGINDYDNLTVLDFKFAAVDEYGSDVSSLINDVLVDGINLGDTKRIKIMTGRPELEGTPVFSGSVNSDDTYNLTMELTFNKPVYRNIAWLWDPSANGGLGSFTIPNEVTAIQKNSGYRIPSVLTEAEYNRYKSRVNTELTRKIGGADVYPSMTERFDDFYEEGTNGYANGKADVSRKYILKFSYDTHAITPSVPNSGTGIVPSGDSAISKFAEAFRQAEKVSLSINSPNVNVNTSARKVIVSFTGTDALRVPGAEYDISYQDGFIQDLLGNTCRPLGYEPSPATAPYFVTYSVPGVSRPFIRVEKSQDEIYLAGDPLLPSAISGNAASTNWPRLVAVQPTYAYLTMDSRTPGSDVMYTKIETKTSSDYSGSNTAGNYWSFDKSWTKSQSAGQNYYIPEYNKVVTSTNPKQGGMFAGDPVFGGSNKPQNLSLASNNIPTFTGTFSQTNQSLTPATSAVFKNKTGDANTWHATYARAMRIGDAPTANGVHQGYRLRIMAQGAKESSPGSGTYTTFSTNVAEDMIYRTVLSFKGNNIPGAGTTGGQRNFGSGDQLWVRGGNTLYGTDIPKFPLTAKDDFTQLTGDKRAGIRLMSKVNDNGAGTSLNSSAWQFVSWEINATAYITLYLGNDDDSSAAEAKKLGPRNFAAQIGNWSILKEYYALFPGDSLWLHNTYPVTDAMMGSFTFNRTLDTRLPYVAVSGITYTATPTAVAGVPKTLSATVAPVNASFKTITWTIVSAGTTGATITGDVLNTTAAGTVVVRASIESGSTTTTPFIAPTDFTITVSP